MVLVLKGERKHPSYGPSCETGNSRRGNTLTPGGFKAQLLALQARCTAICTSHEKRDFVALPCQGQALMQNQSQDKDGILTSTMKDLPILKAVGRNM